MLQMHRVQLIGASAKGAQLVGAAPGCKRCGGLGEYTPVTDSFDCAYNGVYYVCYPKDYAAGGKGGPIQQSIINMQKAADNVLLDMRLWNFTVAGPGGTPMRYNDPPIGSSAAGYDGDLGQGTAEFVMLALLAATQLQREAGEPDPSFKGMIVEGTLDYPTSMPLMAQYADEITAFLNDIHARARDMVATAAANDAAKTAQLIKDGWDALKAKTASVFLNPPPAAMPPSAVVDPSILSPAPGKTEVPVRAGTKIGAGIAIAGAAIVTGLAAYFGTRSTGAAAAAIAGAHHTHPRRRQ